MLEEMDNQIQEVIEEVIEETEDTTEQTDVETTEMTQAEKQGFLKIKYNKEEIELDEEKTREYAQKGMNYDKVQQKLQELESDPRLSFVEKQATKYNMTVEQYLNAVSQEEEQSYIRELAEKEGISTELAERLHRLELKETEREKLARQADEKTKKDEDLKLFIDTYPEIKPNDIPQSVWLEFENGKSLIDAYTKHENQLLKTKLTEFEKSQQTKEQLKENAEASTGSLTGNGNTNGSTLTPEMIENMTDKERMSRWQEVKKIMNMK